MDKNIIQILNKATDGGMLNRAEIIDLLSVQNLSPESFAIQQAGRTYETELSDGFAEVHAHIGLDASPCPMDCEFCSFAECNGVFHEEVVHPLDKILSDARDLESSGANAIYMVTTIRYGRQQLLDVAAAIKETLTSDIPLVANIADFGPEYARELKRVGVDGVYHAIRLGEGVCTRGKKEQRIRTIESALDAGLKVGNCIEPIGPEHAPEEIADLIILMRSLGVVFSGAMRRTTVPGSSFEKYGDISFGRLATVAAVTALATGPDILGNCSHEPSQLCAQAGANIMWASRGTDPRDTSPETQRGYSVGQVREIYFETDWKVWEGPSRYYQ